MKNKVEVVTLNDIDFSEREVSKCGIINSSRDYIKNALIPDLMWIPCPQEYGKVLSASSLKQDHIHLFKVSEHIFASMMNWIREPTEQRFEEAFLLLFSQIDPWLADVSEVQFRGVIRNSCGLGTTTWNKAQSRFMGLHVDDNSSLPMNKKDNARWRLCINVGEEPRTLLFSSVPLRTIVNSSATGDIVHWEDLLATGTPQALIDGVFKISLFPQEGYIMPTETILHDGSTFEMSSEDKTIVLRSHFKISR